MIFKLRNFLEALRGTPAIAGLMGSICPVFWAFAMFAGVLMPRLPSTLELDLKTYNHHIPQCALHHRSPVQALKDWQRKKPELFVKRSCEQSGLDS